MSCKQRSKNSLQLAGYLFLAIGLIALGEMFFHAAKGVYRFNFGILGIGVFAGLRRYSPMWRACALLFAWYSLVTVSVSLAVCLLWKSPLAFPLIVLLLVTLWQLRVLRHPAVRRLFQQAQPVAPTGSLAMAEAAVKQ